MDLTLTITIGILLGCFIALSWFAGTDAPYVPTKKERIRKILLEAGVKKGIIFYELGSGDGRVVIEAAKLRGSAFGIEQSLIRLLLSRFIAFRSNIKNATFIHGDIFKQDLSHADVVFIFLLTKGIAKLEGKLRRELKKGAIIISQTFHLTNWKPYKKILVTSKNAPNTTLGKEKLEGDFWLYR